MTNAEDRARKSIRSKSFEKYIAVANNKNGEEFFDQVRFSIHLMFTPFTLPSLNFCYRKP